MFKNMTMTDFGSNVSFLGFLNRCGLGADPARESDSRCLWPTEKVSQYSNCDHMNILNIYKRKKQ